MSTNMAPAHACPDVQNQWHCCRKALASALTHKIVSRETVAVFFLEQDTQLESPCTVQSRDTCRAWTREGKGKFVNRGEAFRLYERSTAKERLPYFLSRSAESAASISFDEMQANVGITNDPVGFPANRATVRKARQKIRAIGRGLRDERTVLAFGRWPLKLGGEVVAVR